MMAMPVTPVISVTTCVSCTFICCKSLLHVLNMGRPMLDQTGSMPQVSPQGYDLAFGSEGTAQQAHTVQPLNPLAVLNVRLCAQARS